MAGYPLAGIRVVELSERGAAAYAGKLLRRLGADLVKVEPPGGDPLRRAGSRRHEAGGRSTTAAFDFFNEGKRSEAADPARLRELVADADAFVLDLEPRRYEAWGLSPEGLSGLGCNVVCAIAPFGLTGPYHDYRGPELVTSAFGGSSIGIGAPGRPPLKMPFAQTAIQAGLVAAIAALGAVYDPPEAEGDGEGAPVVDIAESDVWATVHTGTTVVSYLFSNRLRSRQGRRVLGQPYPHQLFRCADGWIAIQASERHQHERFMEMVGSPGWAAERRFGSRLDMNDQHADEVDALLAPWFEARTREQIFEQCRARNIPAAPVRSVADVRADPDLQASDAFERFEGASGVALTLPAPPYRFAEAELAPPGPVPAAPEPAGVTSRIEDPPRRNAPPTSESAPPREGLLEGVRVLDFGWVWAGAVPGQMLAFLGAEVIKVETRKRLDYMRQGRAIVKHAPDTEQQPMFHNINRGKLSLSIDFTTDEGRDLLLDLVERCDVAIENFAPGVLDRYGLGYEALRARRPDLVMLSMSGGGQRGPLRELRSYASTIAAFSGLDSLAGYPGEAPLGVQQSYPDPNASLHGAVALLAALIRRRHTGRGDHIDLSQLAAGLQTSAEAMAWLDLFDEVPASLGNAPPNEEPIHDCFRCAGDDEWVAVAAEDDADLEALAGLLSAPAGDAVAVRSALEGWCAEREPRRAMEELQAAGVPAGAVTTAKDRFEDPHYRARSTYIETEHPSIGWELVYRAPWIWPQEIPLANNRAPLMGEHNEYVVCELLGRPREDLERLVEQQVLY